MNGQLDRASADSTLLGGATGPLRAIPRRHRGLLLILVSGLLVLLGTIGVLYDGSLVWLNRLEHPFIFGCVAATAFGVGLLQLVARLWMRVVIVVVIAAVVIGWFAIGTVVLMLFGTSRVDSADAPGGDYEAVVVEGTDVINTVWYVKVRQHRGLLSREWVAGCVSDDLPGNEYEDVDWESPTRLVLFTDWQRIEIQVDPRTGRPKSRIPAYRSGC